MGSGLLLMGSIMRTLTRAVKAVRDKKEWSCVPNVSWRPGMGRPERASWFGVLRRCTGNNDGAEQ